MTFRARRAQLLKSTFFKDRNTIAVIGQVTYIRSLTKVDGYLARKCVSKEQVTPHQEMECV